MTNRELDQFIEAVVNACQFSPRVDSAKELEWKHTITHHPNGIQLLMEAINRAEGEKVKEVA